VEVITTHSRTNTNSTTYKADAVIVTLPLGVLKESLRSNGINSIQFIPPLPEWKTAALNRLGFGNLNKVRWLLFCLIQCTLAVILECLLVRCNLFAASVVVILDCRVYVLFSVFLIVICVVSVFFTCTYFSFHCKLICRNLYRLYLTLACKTTAIVWCWYIRSCCALIGSSGTQTQTCSATLAAQQQVVASCSCSGISTKHLFFWHLWLVKQLPSWRTLAMTSSSGDPLLSWRAFLATAQYRRYSGFCQWFIDLWLSSLFSLKSTFLAHINSNKVYFKFIFVS